MSITKDEVKRIAGLSRLQLADSESEGYTKHLNSILQFAEQLDTIDTSNVKPTSHALDISNVFREDDRRESILRETALKNAPQQKNGQFRVPTVMEG